MTSWADSRHPAVCHPERSEGSHSSLRCGYQDAMRGAGVEPQEPMLVGHAIEKLGTRSKLRERRDDIAAGC